MKKLLILVLVVSLTILSLTGCGAPAKDSSSGPSDNNGKEKATPLTIKVGASPEPHGEILKIAKSILEKDGVNLEIIEFADYNQPNLRLADKELDANYFQHIPFLESFIKEHNLNLTYIAKVHVEPMGIYSQKIKNLKDLKEGSEVAIPNDPTNGGRALLLLQQEDLLKLKEGAGISATVNDIVENPRKLKITELEAATLPRVLQDVDAAVINSNYAFEAKLVPTEDALAIESAADSPYVNILAVRQDDDRPEIKKLAAVLNSPEVKEFIEKQYKGAVIPAF